jgi:hypothetical protein
MSPAAEAGHGVGAGLAVEDVAAAVAGDDVVQGVASAVDVGDAKQQQILDVGAERQRHVGVDLVAAGIGGLGHDVVGVVDDVGIVTLAAGHGVVATEAIEEVGVALPVSCWRDRCLVPPPRRTDEKSSVSGV